MPFLPALAVVFVGVLGGGHGKVEQQVASVVKKLKVQPLRLLPPQLKALAHHGAGTRELVRGLHADGVIAFEIHDGTLRLVIYDSTGQLKTYLDTPFGPRGIDKDDLDTLRQTMESDVGSLRNESVSAEPEPEIEIDAPPAAPPPPSKPAKHVAPESAPAAVPEHVAAPDAPEHVAAPTTTAEATESVSADEIEALVSGGGAGPTASAPAAQVMRIGASLGLGITSRSFSPGPATIPAYASAAVGMVHLDGHISPTERFDLGVVAERTLVMSTPLRDGMASTSISRWEATAGYALLTGSIVIGPEVGIGRRAFAIDSTDPARAPDGNYDYLIAGLAGSTELGSHFALRGVALFEPVVAGDEPTEMVLGEASRWAFDIGLAVEYHRGHLFARGGAEYQQFSWSWDNAGARGGSAVDGYPSGTLSLGADY